MSRIFRGCSILLDEFYTVAVYCMFGGLVTIVLMLVIGPRLAFGLWLAGFFGICWLAGGKK